ncbi:MAG: hypothetical protein CVV42_06385 [Candidatus Riflebacteria bacterium HGW-Riflebacteria-2]|jgi:hypothetical protein|nr:MAG: hypothetical protein CVV42_06385 [Candidatus Riflebacteria bacterium HGW-Riflebacteria-2]
MALPIILGLVLFLAIWIGSLAWSMTNSRSRFQQVVKARKAYFMARSGLQHFLLKLKMSQRKGLAAMRALEQANEDEKKVLYSVFLQDIIVPPDNSYSGERYDYRVTKFNVESVDYDSSRITMQVEAEGSFGGQKNSISRLIRVSR